MAALYIDNDVSVRLAQIFRERGHDVVTASDRGLAQAKDPIQLLTAAQEGRLLLTHNRRDFVLLHEAWHSWLAPWGLPDPPLHGGILIVPQPLPNSLADVIDRLLTSSHRIENELYRWRPSDGWSIWLLGSTWRPLALTS